MIKRLVIHRFRGIRQGTLEDFGKFNVLIGPNNSGKTSILEMLYLASVAGRECEVLTPDVEPSAWNATTLNRRDFLHKEPILKIRERHNEPKMLESSPAVLTDEYTLSVELTNIPKDYPLRKFTLTGPPEEGGRKPVFGKRDISRISLFRLSPHAVVVPEPLTPDYFDSQGTTLKNSYWVYLWEEPWVYRWNKEKPADYFAVWAVEGQLPDADHVLFFDLHTAMELFEQKFAQNAYRKTKNWEDYIAKHLGKVFAELQGVKVNLKPHKGNKWTGFIEFPNREPIPIDHFGDGARHAFKVLASLIALRERVSKEKPGLFLWEDPELFMHPRSLNKLLKEVLFLVKDKPIQVFLSSQSIELIAMLTAQIENFNLQSQYRVFRLDLEQGQLYMAKYHYENVFAWLESGMDLRFWNAEDLPISYNYKQAIKTSLKRD